MGKVIRVIHFDWSLGVEGPGLRTGVDVETCLKLNVVTPELEFRGLGDATPTGPRHADS